MSNDKQIVLDFEHEPSLSEQDFIVCEANRLAFEHILSFPNWPTPLSLIIGEAKTGKSHLAKIWLERARGEVVTKENISSFATDSDNRPLLLEDVDRVRYCEADLFHLLNQSIRNNRPILMSARQEISGWPYKTDDLLSRARLATSFFVRTPDDAELSQMFAKLFSDRQIDVTPKIIPYLVSRMQRQASEVVALVEIMDKIALSRNKPIGRKIAAEALEIRMAQKEEDE